MNRRIPVPLDEDLATWLEERAKSSRRSAGMEAATIIAEARRREIRPPIPDPPKPSEEERRRAGQAQEEGWEAARLARQERERPGITERAAPIPGWPVLPSILDLEVTDG